jgi:hypothetical protein
VAILAVVGCGTDSKQDCDPSLELDAWTDADDDGAGDPATAARVCSLADDQVTNSDDCDDSDPDISPFTPEACDGIDQDCDGTPDDGLVGGTWYADTDGDGYGDPLVELKACMQPPDSTQDKTDCDDTHRDAHPGANEVCDEYDDNCDGLIDDNDPSVDLATGTSFYLDNDGDGYGDDANPRVACHNPNPEVMTDVGGDCDDASGSRNPGIVEVCDTVDNDCDDLIDDDDPTLDLTTTDSFYEDLDEDGVGSSVVVQACFAGPGVSSITGDCDDNEPLLTQPGNWVYDNDLDGVGAGAVVGAASCTQPVPGTVPQPPEDDCNDGDPAIYPGAVEVCGDLVDSDCDGDDCGNWTQDFELGPPIPVEFTLSGNANWQVTSQKAYDGTYSGVNGNIGDLQSSSIAVVLDFPQGGSISFWHSGDTEPTYDFLYFYVDGAQTFAKDGNWGWQQRVTNVGAGVHSFKWTYQKDVSISVGADSIWVDDIEAIGGAP